jgi:2-polyprenyl-3-methyl-5-hydroxy-6-metoxy-1,4-benzoquinol methylase
MPVQTAVWTAQPYRTKGRAEKFQEQLGDLFDDGFLTDCYMELADCEAKQPACNDRAWARRVQETMEMLLGKLGERQAESSDLEWDTFVNFCLKHPIRHLVWNDPFTHRAFQKPRGYAGDASLLDYIYGADEIYEVSDTNRIPADTSPLGRAIFATTTRTPTCEGVRTRARLVAEMVDRLVLEKPGANILSIASGHLREANLTGALKRRRVGRWVAFDADSDSLREVQACYASYGVEAVAGTVRQLLRRKLELGTFDFIYSTGLYDYLQQPLGQRLTERLFEMLRPGGQLLIANFLVGIAGRGYMESFMDWKLIYRSHPQMLDLAMSIDRSRIHDIRLKTEESQHIVFLLVTKKQD